jgi:type II secretory pathway pseudopilin PulG
MLMPRPPLSRQRQQGFTYLMLMIAIVFMGLTMSVAARQWKVMVQRE